VEERRAAEERREEERRTRVPGPPGPPGGRERRERTVGWRNRDILRTTLLVMGVYIVLQLLWFASSLFFVGFLGILFGLALSGGVDQLKRWGIPRAIGAALIVLAFLGALGGMGALIAPTVRDQAESLRHQLPQAIDMVEEWLERHSQVVGAILGEEEEAAPAEPVAPEPAVDTVPGPVPADVAPTVEPAPPPSPAPDGEPAVGLRQRMIGDMGNLMQYLFPFLSSTLAVLTGVLAIIFIAIYISVQPDVYHRGLMHLFPHRSREKAGHVLSRMAIMLRRWLVTQLVAMVAVGAITTAALVALQVPSAVALGVLAGLLEFVPIIGPVIASVPAIAMAFLDSPQKAVAVTLVFIVIQQLESQILTPILMSEGVDLPPVMTLMVQSLMVAVFGFIGLIVAVPLLATAMVPIKILYVEDVVGDEMELPGDD
jgi:predicted PurR-regulated permease PerM